MDNDSSSGSHNSSPRKERARSLSSSNTRVPEENVNDAQLDDALFAKLTGARMSAHNSSHAIPSDSSLIQGGCLSSSGFADPLFVHEDVVDTHLLPFSSLDYPWDLLLQHPPHPNQFTQTQGDSSTASSSSQPHCGPSLTIQNVNPSESLDHSSIPASASTSASTVGPNSSQTEFDRAMTEEKRRRNTEASARFRIKKKQKIVNLERTVSDLKGRTEDLEREAADLRRENGWLKEIVVLKGSRLAIGNLAGNIIANDGQRAAERRKSISPDGDTTDVETRRKSKGKNLK